MRWLGAAVLAFFALAMTTTANADDAAVLYDPATVTQIDLTLSDASLQALRDEPKEYAEADASLTLPDGSTVGPHLIGVKLKGNTSFRTIDGKAAFKLKFGEFVDKQRVLGLKGMTLNNMVQDRSHLRETVSYAAFRAAGLVAPRTGYAYVRVNGVARGLYLNVENYDDLFLERFYPTTQHLYEGEASADFEPSRRFFETDEGDEDDESDLDALIAAANDTEGDWSDGMAAVADLGQMTRMWAAESFVGHWDGYSVYGEEYLPNNYYVHSDAAGVFTMLPWGLDQTLTAWRKPIGQGRGVLFRTCIADASCAALYREQLREVSSAQRAQDLPAVAETAAETVVRWRACPGMEVPDPATWDGWTQDSFGFLRTRRAEVAAYLGTEAPTPLEVAPVPAAEGRRCPLDPEPEPTPDPEPTASPTPTPTASPTAEPTAVPTADPTAAPTAIPSPAPTTSPTPGAVRRCVVPKLRGVTLRSARRAVRRSGCSVGVVKRRGRAKDRRRAKAWRVKRSRPGVGRVRPFRDPVLLIVVPRRR